MVFQEGSPQGINRLFTLGLEEEWLRNATRYALGYASECTANDPPSMAGTLIWGKTTRALRDILIPKGWRAENPRNYATTVSPDGQYGIVVAAGDGFTGRIDGIPTTRSERGPATFDAVALNQATLWEYSAEFPSLEIKQTWFLLHFENIEDGEITEIRLELSLPAGITDGIVDSWNERIILQSVTTDLDAMGEDADEGEDFDVPVEKK